MPAKGRLRGTQSVDGRIDLVQNSAIRFFESGGNDYVELKAPASLPGVGAGILNQYAEVAISKAEIMTLFSVGKTLTLAPGAGYAIEFVAIVLISDFGVAAYTAGGALTVEYSDGGVLSNTISAANSFGNVADKINLAVALDTATGLAMKENVGLVLKAATADFTDPGTAVGVGRAKVVFRTHVTGL